jgi:hypothetical protein
MKEKKFIVVVEFEDGTRQEYITYDENTVGKGMSFKGGKIVAVRKLTTKYVEKI